MIRRVVSSILLVAVAASASVFVMAPQALACSCIAPDVSSLDAAPAVVSGVVVAVTDLEPTDMFRDPYVATLQVDRDLKDNLDDLIHLESEHDDGGNCGVTVRVGDRIAAMVYDGEGSLFISGCGIIGEALMDQWQAPVNRSGEVHAIAGTWGDAYRLIAFDGEGEPLAYGFESGVATTFGVCADETGALAEVVMGVSDVMGPESIAIRSLADFTVATTFGLDIDEGLLEVAKLGCSGPIEAPDVTVWGRVSGVPGADFGVWVHDGSQFVPDDGAAAPTTGTNWVEIGWPTTVLSNGATIATQDQFNTLYELDRPVTISPSDDAPVARQLGAGTAPGAEPGVTQDVADPTPEPEQAAEGPAEAPAEAPVETPIGFVEADDSQRWLVPAVAGGAMVVALAAVVFARRRWMAERDQTPEARHVPIED